MKHYYKQANVIFSTVLLLCFSGIVFSSISQLRRGGDFDSWPEPEDITLKDITVRFQFYDFMEEHHYKDINLRIKRTWVHTAGTGCGNAMPRGKIPIPNTADTLEFSGCRPVVLIDWRIGGRALYQTDIDSTMLQKLNDAIRPIDETMRERIRSSPSSSTEPIQKKK